MGSGASLNLEIALALGLGVGAVIFYFVSRKLQSKRSDPVTLTNPDEKIALPLLEKKILSHDTRLFRFGLPTSQHVLGLPILQHVYFSAIVDGKIVVRPYTPVSSDDDHGYTEFVIKVYFANVHPKYPDGGKLTQYLEKLEIGQTIDVRGPNGLIVYKGRGKLEIKKDKKTPAVIKTAKKIGMISGGSGITPMLQLIRHVFKDPNDKTELWLLFANQTEDDILLRAELERIASDYPDQFHLWYTLDRAPPNWRYSEGFVNEEMIRERLPPPADDTLILMCGPPPMIQFACHPNLDQIGYAPTSRFAF